MLPDPWIRTLSPQAAHASKMVCRLAGACALAMIFMTEACHQPRAGVSHQPGQVAADRPVARRSAREPIRHVLCLYEQKPWLSLDTAGDKDPEGIEYRVFLLNDSQKGVLRDGTFHVEMYRIERDSEGDVKRILVSDWHYAASAFQPVRGILGMGYHVGLRWARKDIAGSEIEIITRYEDIDGSSVRSATKRLRVPKYSS